MTRIVQPVDGRVRGVAQACLTAPSINSSCASLTDLPEEGHPPFTEPWSHPPALPRDLSASSPGIPPEGIHHIEHLHLLTPLSRLRGTFLNPQMSFSGVSRLWSAGQIWPTAYFCHLWCRIRFLHFLCTNKNQKNYTVSWHLKIRSNWYFSAHE